MDPNNKDKMAVGRFIFKTGILTREDAIFILKYK